VILARGPVPRRDQELRSSAEAPERLSRP
jgi:hypothetical protein